MFAKLKKQEKGFTIIEVLIVLAIAGLIMLVVFLAVPALQRNSRNTQRKADVSALLGAVTEFSTNNNGQLPTTAAEVTANARLGYYTAGVGNGAGQVNLATGAQGSLGTTSAGDRVVVVMRARCGAGGATAGGGARQVAIQYQIESSGNPVPACQDS